ncbi:MAG: UvrD-helicase domain-containing protein [Acidimicrobiales bacterium]
MSGPATLPLPLDHDARDTVAFDLDRSLLVEAGAGTGKTTVLVNRVVELVVTGRVADASRLAAITFTEAAAAELRDRIRRALERAALDPARAADERARADAAVRGIDEAAITTIHGFAHRILVEHALDAGLPPAFEVDEGVRASLERDQRWRRFCDDLFADPGAEPDLRLAFTLGLNLRRLHQLATAFHGRWDRLVGVRLEAPPVPTLDLGRLEAALKELPDLVAPRAHQRHDRLVRIVVDQHLPLLAWLRAASDDLERIRVLATARLSRPGLYGTADVWGDDKVLVHEAVRRVLDERVAVLGAVRAAILERLLPRLQAFTLAGAEERRREGRLEFHDLLVFARDLLRTDAHARETLSRRLDVICIDEFQDTDPIQLEIAMLLAARDPAGPPPSTFAGADLADGKLLIVGDPKQSIYRFRGADIALWTSTHDAFHGRTVQLTQNFRSVPGILDWVNHVFDRLLGDRDDEQQAAHVALAAARHRLSDQPAVVVVGGPADEAAAEIRRRESDDVARLLRVIKDEGWGIHEPLGDDRDCRPVRFADIALLVPTRTPLGELERALDSAGVPYRVESRSLVWATDEVRMLLAVLTAVDDPADEVAVVAALRSPAFACADPELADFRLAGGHWDYLRPVPGGLAADHPVVAALAELGRFHHRRWWEPVNLLVERVVRERRMVELTMGERRPRDHWRRLRFVLDQARAFVEDGGQSLGEFIAWAALQPNEGAQVVEAVVPEHDDDAVRMLTVHGAKGLEFPVVVLAGLGTGVDPARPQVLWGEHRPEVAFGSRAGARFETSGYAELDVAARQAEAAESLRLLYVAATRGRDHLVVSLHHRPSRNGIASHAERLGRVLSAAEGLYRAHEIPDQLTLPLGDPAGGRVRAETTDERDAWIGAREALLAGAAATALVAATRLSERPDDAGARVRPFIRRWAGAEAGDDDEAGVVLGHDAAAGTAMGRAVHAVLEAVDIDAPDDGLDGLAATLAASEGLPDAGNGVAALARSVLGAGVVVEARSAVRRWRELYVAVPVGERVLEGYVDLAYEGPDGQVTVVDYKTDRARSDADVDDAVDRYRLQAAGYALAVGELLGRPVRRCVFVFARRGGAVERELPDLAGAIHDVRALLHPNVR